VQVICNYYAEPDNFRLRQYLTSVVLFLSPVNDNFVMHIRNWIHTYAIFKMESCAHI